MRKILYTVLAAGTILFTTSCTEDKGTSTEVASANKDEKVNPNHIRPYTGMDSLTQMVREAGPGIPQNGQLATEIVKVYYEPNRNMTDLLRQYNFNETARMGGQTSDTAGATSGSDPMEQQSMTTVQDSLNEVTGAKNKSEARPEQDKSMQKSSTTKQQPASGTKTQKQ